MISQHKIYDCIVRNGLVVDGSGRPSFLADVAILDDRIAKLVT